MANNTFEFTGSTTIAELLTNFGKVVDKRYTSITLTLEQISIMQTVAAGAQPNKDDIAAARACMTVQEQEIIDRFEAKKKEFAVQRKADAPMIERWTIKGTATKA